VAYVDVSELQRVLAKPAPTAAEAEAMQRVLDEAGAEIDWELSYDPVDNPPPASGTPQYGILTEVNLSRSVELWNMEFRPFGVMPVGPDTIPIVSARDSWYRHRLRLLPLKTSWGIG
jgi:hypothetical protein